MMTVEEYDRRFAEQGGRCAMCKQIVIERDKHGVVKRLNVDHDHATGEVRGLLCTTCNKAEGFVTKYGKLVAAYLAAHEATKALDAAIYAATRSEQS